MENFRHFFRRHWDITEQAQYQLGECDALVRAITNTPLRPKDRQELMTLSLIKGAQATTAIEGNTLTQEEVERIYDGEDLPQSREYLQIEVENILTAFNRIKEEVFFNSADWLITPELLLSFHKMVGENLGKHFDAIPGKWRTDNRQVGAYLAPDYQHVESLIKSLCEWIRQEFHYGKSRQDFKTSVIQAIITHVYIEWIHPFGDGNGRTGRLVEFYILLRAGLPDITSHILPNHYNKTRTEYYRQFNECRRRENLTGFIEYAVSGFRDGLVETINTIQDSQFKIFWKNHIYTTFSDMTYNKKGVFERKRNLMLGIPLTSWKTKEEILIVIPPPLALEYMHLSQATMQRDLNEMVDLGLLVKEEKRYRPNTSVLHSSFPQTRAPHPGQTQR